MPGNGDPQTPGIAALEGMFRRSFNDSELPPIPAHPIGYGDAIHFLKRIKGNICFHLLVLFLFLPSRVTIETRPATEKEQERHPGYRDQSFDKVQTLMHESVSS